MAYRRYRRQSGISLIEMLVTMVILAIGLLGVMGLQARLQQSEMDSYQRSQALILLDDMAHRLAANRNDAANYVTGTSTPLGVGMTCPTTNTTQRQRDLAQWCAALQGAAETGNAGANRVGAMIGGRGCIASLGSGQYLITVAWQGLVPLGAPPAGVGCGQGSYNGATGSECANDRCRRVVTTLVRVAPL